MAKITANQLAKQLENLPRAMKMVAAKELHAFARNVIVPASKDNAPMELGVLRGTIDAPPPEIQGSKVIQRVVAGGPAAPYTIAIHEHLSEHSPPSWVAAENEGRSVHFSVGGPKFMERALNDNKDKMTDAVAGKTNVRDVWKET